MEKSERKRKKRTFNLIDKFTSTEIILYGAVNVAPFIPDQKTAPFH